MVQITILAENFNVKANPSCTKDFILIEGISDTVERFCNREDVNEITKMDEEVGITFRSNEFAPRKGFHMTLIGIIKVLQTSR